METTTAHAICTRRRSQPALRPTISTSSPGPAYFRLKRLADVTASLALIVLLSPLLALIALAIAIESRGGVIYRQERIGSRRRKRGTDTDAFTWELRHFDFLKFRSMVADADTELHEAHIEAFVTGQLDPAVESFKLQRDPRVTRVGRVIRKTSLDELPQLFNVLRGEMSLVGPRPIPPYEIEHYEDEHYERFGALAGLTGLWQVSGRCALPFEDMMRLDLEYVKRQSVRLDLAILLRTIPAVISGRGGRLEPPTKGSINAATISMSGDPTGVAVIGCGYWGINYVRVFSELPDGAPVVVCDTREERLEEIGRRFPEDRAHDRHRLGAQGSRRRGGRCRHPGPDALRRHEEVPRGRQARARREAAHDRVERRQPAHRAGDRARPRSAGRTTPSSTTPACAS